MAGSGTSHTDRAVSLDDEVEFLSCPEAYGDSTRSVSVIETHKSWVFLTEHLAFKLKKAIRYDSVDFRSLRTRQLNSVEEVRLNRRLAPDVYLGTVPVTVESDGSLALDGAGRPIDWLVKMRRLPEELMMDRKILDGSCRESDVARVATKLACFYQDAKPAVGSGGEYRRTLLQEIDINERDLLETGSIVSAEQAADVIRLQRDFLDQYHDLVDGRTREGHVVEGHGDLRPEHICLVANPAIIDCLEFNARLRVVDAIDELAFLSLQCELLDASWVQKVLLDTYVKITGDSAPEHLIRFYKSYRAAIWSRLAVWRARDLSGDALAKWVGRGQVYLNLALTYARQSF